MKVLFQKTAVRVNTMQVDGKKKRRVGGHDMGQRNDWKKAIVTLKAGEVVTTGICHPPLPIQSGDRFEADFGIFGKVSVALI